MKEFAEDLMDDAWIIANGDKLKATLQELANSGKPKPADGTLLARALDLFTAMSPEHKFLDAIVGFAIDTNEYDDPDLLDNMRSEVEADPEYRERILELMVFLSQLVIDESKL